MDDYKITRPEDQAVTAGPPEHPGDWIRHNVLEPFGLTVSETARRIKMDRASLSNVLGGQHALSRDLAYKLEALTGVDADLMIGMQAAFDRHVDQRARARYAREIERVAPVEASA